MKFFLVVDDFRRCAALSGNLLKELGYANVDGANGVMGLAKLRAESYDFVVSDWNMPNMDGLTMLQHIAPTQHWPSCSTMVTTEAKKKKTLSPPRAERTPAVMLSNRSRPRPSMKAEPFTRKLEKPAPLISLCAMLIKTLPMRTGGGAYRLPLDGTGRRSCAQFVRSPSAPDGVVAALAVEGGVIGGRHHSQYGGRHGLANALRSLRFCPGKSHPAQPEGCHCEPVQTEGRKRDVVLDAASDDM
jgi:two-component system chemotaxis response regulator CheY